MHKQTEVMTEHVLKQFNDSFYDAGNLNLVEY